MSRHIRQSTVDGKWRRWELMSGDRLGIQDPEEADMKRSDGSSMREWHQVCTGVFETKSAAKAATYGRRRR